MDLEREREMFTLKLRPVCFECFACSLSCIVIFLTETFPPLLICAVGDFPDYVQCCSRFRFLSIAVYHRLPAIARALHGSVHLLHCQTGASFCK